MVRHPHPRRARARRSIAAVTAALVAVATLALVAPASTAAQAAPATGAAACSGVPGQAGGTVNGALDHRGRRRAYVVHVPQGYDPSAPTPVVLLLHGQGSYGLQQMLYGDYLRFSDRHGFLVVAPDVAYPDYNQWQIAAGVGATPNVPRSVDDLGFIRKLLDRIEGTYCVDTNRVHAAGISSGAFFVSRLACRLSDRIASVVSVAGTVYFDDSTGDCGHDRPVPVLAFHGSADINVPFDAQTGGRDSPHDGVMAQLRRWAILRNGCAATSTVTQVARDVSIRNWDCPAAGATRLVRIQGGGHTWPGSPFDVPANGPTSRSVSATAMGWRFFVNHPLTR